MGRKARRIGEVVLPSTQAHEAYLKARIADLVVAKHSHKAIQAKLKSENLVTTGRKITNVLNELREEWRQKASTNTELLVGQELASLDTLQSRLWPEALEGKVPILDRVMKIMEHRARLLGLYAPTQRRVTGEVAIIKAYMNLDVEQV